MVKKQDGKNTKWNLTEFHTHKGFLPEVNSYTNMFIYRNETLICGTIKYTTFFITQDYLDVFISDSLHEEAHFTVSMFLTLHLHYLIANICLEFPFLLKPCYKIVAAGNVLTIYSNI